jgi:hypothetical protein
VIADDLPCAPTFGTPQVSTSGLPVTRSKKGLVPTMSVNHLFMPTFPYPLESVANAHNYLEAPK